MTKITIAVFALLLFFSVASEARFLKVLPFADDASVRVEYDLQMPGFESNAWTEFEIVASNQNVLVSSRSQKFSSFHSGEVIRTDMEFQGLEPDLWSPSTPVLYDLKLRAVADGKVFDATSLRFGFRKVESRDGKIYLNGKPLFLRGLAINPPGRGVPDEVSLKPEYARNYIRFMKDHNVNIIRLQNQSQIWFDLCDEMGMMVYQGCYGSPPGGEKRKMPDDFQKTIEQYKQKFFEGYLRHPSIIINVLANELPYNGTIAEPYQDFVRKAWNILKQWDPNRLYIGNAGYGDGKSGDIFDFHRYWGWYYGSVLTFYRLRDYGPYNALREHKDDNPQPITMTECVGSYTMPNGRFNVIRRQLNAGLGWVGYSDDLAGDSLRHQAFTFKNAVEIFRRLRTINPKLAGIFPFTIPFHYWANIEQFEDMHPKPVTVAMKQAFQPVLLSWELWQNQVYAGTTIHPIAHVVNDSEDGVDLSGATLQYWIEGTSTGQDIAEPIHVRLATVPYFETEALELNLRLPSDLETGAYRLVGQILRGEEVISNNESDIFISQPLQLHTEPTGKSLAVLDIGGKTTSALQRLGFQVISDPGKADVLVIGEETWTPLLTESKDRLMKFISSGGRLVILRQTADRFPDDWLPVKIEFAQSDPTSQEYPHRSRPYKFGSFINQLRPNHPVFTGIDRDRLGFWSDYSNWDEKKEGIPSVFPVTDGVVLPQQLELGQVAMLANYEIDLRAAALFEVFEGEGSIIYSCFDLVNRNGIDPVADRLLMNIVNYALSPDEHPVHPRAKSVIEWGDYSTENGIITGLHNGFLEDVAQIDSATGEVLKTGQNRASGWNVQPGRQFTTRGRRPNGWEEEFGIDDHEDIRSALFWTRVPEGSAEMLTTVENPLEQPVPLQISVNEGQIKTKMIQPGMESLVYSLPDSGSDIMVRYTGDMNLIILRTEFGQIQNNE